MKFNAKKVGLLGGGQLARMLAQEGQKMGLEMHVLSNREDDPAAQVTRFWHRGDVNNPQDVAKFLQKVDALTFESEFVSPNVLDSPSLAAAAGAGKIQPSPELISQFSDRLTQKRWLEKYKIPTAASVELRSQEDFRRFADIHGGLVLKKRRGGYDGYGTFILRDPASQNDWLAQHGSELRGFIAEEFCSFRRELAFQVSLNARGESLVFPLVEWKAEDAKCLWVRGPLRHPKFSAVAAKVVKALKASGYRGIFAVELFETSGGLIVNEVAPRVHNSGHYSLEALPLNQFQAHLRGVLDWPLPKKNDPAARGFAMLNWIGRAQPSEPTPDGVSQHWYGKSEARAGRKMGHFTTLGASADRALQTLLKWKTKTEKPKG